MRPFLLLVVLWSLLSCQPEKRILRETDNAIIRFDLQGHRGARGLLPENSIQAFEAALSHKVTTLELDLAITKDNQVIVSHEPWFSHLFCLDSLGQEIGEEKAMNYNIYQMTLDEINRFDCGSKQNPNFPEQKTLSTIKPKLVDVFRAAEQYIKKNGGLSVDYNIEIKSLPRGDNIFHPTPNKFSDLVYSTIDDVIPWERIVIQSFDFRVLQYFHDTYPEVRLAALVENEEGANANLEKLGFAPQIYSCYYQLLSKEVIDELHAQGILVIPWTVNEIADMERLFQWGVDGLITDYPDRFWQTNIDPNEVIEFKAIAN